MDRQERLLEIFFRCLRGEEISVQKLAQEYGVSTKSISRNLNDLKAFSPNTGNWWAAPSWNTPIKTSATGCIWTNS